MSYYVSENFISKTQLPDFAEISQKLGYSGAELRGLIKNIRDKIFYEEITKISK
jgi:hypothetical protein